MYFRDGVSRMELCLYMTVKQRSVLNKIYVKIGYCNVHLNYRYDVNISFVFYLYKMDVYMLVTVIYIII